MDGRENPTVAAVTFPSARAGCRRVAGVSVAARIVRELAEAGFAEAWLAVPHGATLDSAVLADARRLAGPMDLRLGRPPAEARAFALGPDRLIASGIDLSAPGASTEILRATGKRTDGPVSRWLNRPVSRRLSALLLLWPGLRPLHATFGTVVLALAMFVALVAGGQPGLIAGGLLFHAASVFDGVDGEVARATFRTSRFGATLDSLVDAATNALFIVGVTINLLLAGHDRALVLGVWGLVLFVVGQAVIGFRTARMNAPIGFDMLKHHYRARVAGPAAGYVLSFLTTVSSRDFFALLFASLIVVGLPMAVLYIFAAAATVWILFVAGSLLASPKAAPAAGEG